MMIKYFLILMIIASPVFRGSVSPLAFGVLQILTAIALLWWFLHAAKQGMLRFKRTALDIPIFLFMLLAAFSIFRSPYIHDSMVEFSKLINLAVIFYLTVNCIKDRKDIKDIVKAVVTAGTAFSIFGIIQYFGGMSNSWWDVKDFLSSVYVNHNHFAGFLELAIPVCAGLMFGEKDSGKKFFYSYLFIVMLFAFMLSMSRGGWFSLGLSGIVMLVFLFNKGFIKKRFIILALVFIAIGVFFMERDILKLLIGRIASYKAFDLEGRLEMWKAALGIIKDNPFFGTGIGTFIYFFPRYRPEGLNFFANYTHNDYLQLASEAGIFALGLALCILFLIAKKGMKNFLISDSNFKKGVSIGIFTGVLSIAIHSMVDFNLRIPANAILFTILSGIVFSLRSRNEGPDKYLDITLNRNALIILKPVFTVLMFLWILSASRLVAAEAIVMSISKVELNKKLSSLNKAIYLLPGKSDYYKKIAQLYTSEAFISFYKEKNLLMAIEYYRLATEINPKDSWAWLGAGDSYLYFGDFVSAKGFYKKALDLDPNNSYQLKRMGDLLVRLGEIDEALNIFKRASLLEKKSIAWLNTDHSMYEPETYIEKGDFYYKQTDLEGALKAYKLAEGLGSKEVSVKIANIAEKMGLVNADTEHSLSLKNSENATLLNSKARYLVSIGDYEKAEALIDRAISFDQKDCVTLQNKIDLMQRQKKPFEDICPYMERLLGLNNNDVKGFISGKDAVLVFDLEKDGLMPSSGVKKISFTLPIGLLEVKIFASGTLAEDEWPHMLVRMNSAPILSQYVSSSSYVEFFAHGFSQEGVNLIKIEFSNDYFDSLTGEDRNLKIGKIILTYKSPDYEN